MGGDTTLGKRSFVWDGNDNAGNAAPEGAYRLTGTARGAEGEELPARIGVVGRDAGVETGDGETRLMLCQAAIPLSNVRRLSLDEAAA